MVGQFQRRLRNCHLHSFMAVCSPAAMACKMPGFCRISRRWRRLSRARLGSRTNCAFLELVRRLDEEATLTIPLAQHKDKRNQGQAAGRLYVYLHMALYIFNLLCPGISCALKWKQFSCTTVTHTIFRLRQDSLWVKISGRFLLLKIIWNYIFTSINSLDQTQIQWYVSFFIRLCNHLLNIQHL